MNYNRLFLLLKFANKEGALNALRPHLNFSEEENNSIITALQDFSDKEAPKLVGAILKELKNNPSITSSEIIDLVNSKKRVVLDPTILPLETPTKKESPLGNLLSENPDKDSILQYVSSLSSELTKLVEGLVIKDTSIRIYTITEIIESVKSLPNKYQKWIVNRFGSNANKKELHPIRDCLPVVEDYAEAEQGILNKYSESEDFNKKIQYLLGTTSISNSDLLSSDDMVNILNIYRTADLTLTATKIKQLTTLPLEDKVGEAGEWEVWLPSTRENSCAVARVDKKLDPKTTWCTARTKSSNLFYSYVGISGGNMILFYIIKKNPVAKPETPEEDNDWISIGYFNGERIYNGGGSESVNRSNEGIRDDQHLMEILGDDYSTIISMMDQKNKELGGVSPALVKVQEAARDVDLYLEMTKGNSESERSDLDEAILEIPPSKEVLDKIIEIGAEKSLSAIVGSQIATEDILNRILEKTDNKNVLKSVCYSPLATEDILNKILEKSNDEYVLKNVCSSSAVTENILSKILEKSNDKDVLQSACLSSAVTEDILNKILEKSNDQYVLEDVCRSPAVTENILSKILEISNDQIVLKSVCRSRVVTEDILNKILEKSNDEYVLQSACSSSAVTENILSKILEKSNNLRVLEDVCHSRTVTENILNKLIEKSNDEEVFSIIASSKAVTEAVTEGILNKILTMKRGTWIHFVLMAIIKNPAVILTENILNKIIELSIDGVIFQFIARSPFATEDILNKILEKSNDPLLLQDVCYSPAVTENILSKILEKTNDQYVLNCANKKLNWLKDQKKTANLLAKVNFFYKLAIAL